MAIYAGVSSLSMIILLGGLDRLDMSAGYGVPVGYSRQAGLLAQSSLPPGGQGLIGDDPHNGEVLRFSTGYDIPTRTFEGCREVPYAPHPVHLPGRRYRRLGRRRAQPFPDIVVWFGPFAASAAAIDGLLQPHQPRRIADGVLHDPGWTWTTLDYSAIGTIGAPAVSSWPDLTTVPRLALADPERSEVGMSLLLAVLDRARQAESDAERGWSWWQQRGRSGVAVAEDDAGAAALVGDSGVTHALTLADSAAPLPGLAPLPPAIGLAAHSRHVDDARRLLDWIVSDAPGAMLRMSPWQADANGLQALVAAAPVLDVDW